MIFVAIIAAYSCRSHNKAIKESVSTLIGSTIIFPDSLCAINNYQVEDKELLLLDNKMKKSFYITLFATILLIGAFIIFSCRLNDSAIDNNLITTNTEVLASGEGESPNCIPDENSDCVDGDYRVVQAGYYFSQH